MQENKQRIIQENVPGRQVTLAHLIANPQASIYQNIGLDTQGRGAIGIITLTPAESVIIAADIATKASNVEIGFLDRLCGSLLITGDISSVETAIQATLEYVKNTLQYDAICMTRS